MDLKNLSDMMVRAFDHHVDGLEIAARQHGVTIIPSANLSNTQTVFMVSQSAYDALMKRVPTDSTKEGG